MWTIVYKQHYYISGYCNRELCSVILSPSGIGGTQLGKFKSLHAAKLAVTRHINATNRLINKLTKEEE